MCICRLEEGYGTFIIRSRSALIAAYFALNIFIKLTNTWPNIFLQNYQSSPGHQGSWRNCWYEQKHFHEDKDYFS